MKTFVIMIVGTLIVIASASTRGQEVGRREPNNERTDDLLDEIDEARIRIELLEMEVEADRNQVRRMLEVLKETELQQVQGFTTGPVIGGNSPEERVANIAEYERKYAEVRDGFVERSRELGRKRRHLAELEGRTEVAASSLREDRRGKIPARLLEQILKELEKGEGR